ncbi:energy transducer TonB [Novosphingobium sp. TH158]|uniref:energy transducer TonB n=1 Tax=Novosphingobium sp. TH158 TaxID=2067455 RepID=UPI000C7A3615|nr:energy transducer TonB [Novosphingobium sp. TH158]PLK26676.1 energy transducer TonB [Novosphingobium sp. TH158]
MAYADQQVSGNRITAFIVVALLHVLVGWLLVSGLAYEGFQKVVKKVTTIDIKKDEPKKDEPPPPPPKKVTPPPITVPPTKMPPMTPPPFTAPPPPPQAPPPPPPPVLAPEPPPAAPRVQPKAAVPKGNPGSWATTNDYPSAALREERQGTTRFRVSVGPDGRVTDCTVTGSSGHPDLDAVACSKIKARARFTPATDGEGQPTTGSYSNAIRWVIPKD